MNTKINKLLLAIYTIVFVIINELLLIIASNWYYINFTYERIREEYSKKGEVMPPRGWPVGFENPIYVSLERSTFFSYVLFEFILVFLFLLSIGKLKKVSIDYKKISLYSLLISFSSYFILTPYKIDSFLAFTEIPIINTPLGTFFFIIRLLLIFVLCLYAIKILFKKK